MKEYSRGTEAVADALYWYTKDRNDIEKSE
jgi:hypothetical protein